MLRRKASIHPLLSLMIFVTLIGCSKKTSDHDESASANSSLKRDGCTEEDDETEEPEERVSQNLRDTDEYSRTDEAAGDDNAVDEDEVGEGESECAPVEKVPDAKPKKPGSVKAPPKSPQLPVATATATTQSTSIDTKLETSVETSTMTSTSIATGSSMATNTQASTSTGTGQVWNAGPGLEGCAAKGLAWRAVVSGGPGECSNESLVKWCCSKENLLVRFPTHINDLTTKFGEYDRLGLKLYHCSSAPDKTTFHFASFSDGTMRYRTLYVSTPARDAAEPERCPNVTSDLLGIPKELIKPSSALRAYGGAEETDN